MHKLLEQHIQKHLQQVLQEASPQRKGELEAFLSAVDGTFSEMEKHAPETLSRASYFSAMAGEIAHEINNPLAIIKMRAELLLDRATSGQADAEAVKSSTGIMIRTIERISEIVMGLRTITRHARKVPMTSISIHELINTGIEPFRAEISEKGIELRCNLGHDFSVDCRPSQMRESFMHLLKNSIEAVATIPKKWVQIDILDLQADCEIRVTDSGPGIPADIQAKVRLPFFTTKGDIKTGEGAAGLGLPIAKGIADQHGGKLQLDTKAANTCFVILLPKKQAVPSAS